MPEPTILDNINDLKTQEPEQTPSEPVNDENKPTDDDIIKKVASYTPEEPKSSETNDEHFNMAEFDQNINAIEDENVRNQFLSLKKSLISGGNNKYQEIAQLRKELESKMSEIEQKSSVPDTWTPEKVQQIANDPKFQEAASQVMQQAQSDEFLTDEEKETRAKIKAIEQQNQQLIMQQQQQQMMKQDESLKTTYPNYNPEAVDTMQADILQGKVQNVRELIWKAHDFNSAVKRAYEMGLKDKKQRTEEEMNSVSFDGMNVVSNTPPVKEKGESSQNFLRRLYAFNSKINKG